MNFRHILMVASRWKKAYATVAAPASFGVENSRLWKRAYTAVAAPASIGVENSRLWKREATVPASASVESFSIWKRACTTVADDDGVSVKAKEASTEKRKMFMQLRSLSEKGGSVHETIRKFMSCEEKKLFHLTKSDLRRWAKLFEKYGHHKQALEILDLLNNSTKVVTCPNSLIPCNHNTSECLGTHSLAHAASIASPSVVSLLIPAEELGAQNDSAGSGFIIDNFGTILTCAHVVINRCQKKKATTAKITVTFIDGTSVIGETIAYDLELDIAIVKIDDNTSVFPPLELGTSSTLVCGEWTLAIGNPLGWLPHTVTKGVISNLSRSSSSDLELQTNYKEQFLIQMECAINPGNSGGPLVNLQAQAVGVVCLKDMGMQKISFAIPIDDVLQLLKSLGYVF